jgi:alkylation response protein AidB-like acyl-CoA dehydrogenase
MGMIAPALGGTGGSIVETSILVEECYAVEPSAALTIFSTGLGLMPFNLIGSALPERGRSFLEPFLKSAGQAEDGGEDPRTQEHAPIASLVFSEPGGVANFLEPGAPGLNTTARRDGDEWIVDGEKLWATNSAGWDFEGADLACVVCRDATNATNPTVDDNADPRDKIMVVVVTRADLDRNGTDCFRVLRHVSTIGHTSVSGPYIRYTSVRVPASNVLATGSDAVRIIFGAFDWTAVLVGAQAVGLMRAAFDAALAFAKRDDRRGNVPLLERQAFADLLSGVKMSTEACRALTWKAAHAMEHGPGDYDARRELALAAKVYCSEAAVKAVMDTIHAVGMYVLNSPDRGR